MEIDEIRPEVIEFAKAMEIKLRKNDYKSHWSGCTNEYLIKRIEQKYRELIIGNVYYKDFNPLDKAVGVANYAMMYWDNNKNRSNHE